MSQDQTIETIDDQGDASRKPRRATAFSRQLLLHAMREAHQLTLGACTDLLAIAPARTALIALAVFVFDWLTPLGIASGVLYIAAVLSAVPIRHQHSIFLTAGACSLLVVIGWLASNGSGETEAWKIVLNRALAIGVIWTAAGMAQSWRRMQERRSRHLQESQLMHQAAALSASQVPFRQALENSLQAFCEILDWPVAHAYWRDRSEDSLAESGVWHSSDDGRYDLLRLAARDLRFARGEGMPGKIWNTRQPLAISDVSQSADFAWLRSPEQMGVKGAFGIPVVVGQRVAAVLEFFAPDPITADSEFLDLANNLGEQIGRLFERRVAEETLRESEQRFRVAVQTLPAAIYVCDAEGRVSMFNKAAEELWGRAPELGKDRWCGSCKIFTPDGKPLPLDQCPMSVAIREGRAIHAAEITIERPGGERRNVLAHPTPLFSPAGNVTGAINLLVDITERKDFEREMRCAKEAAESANRMRSQFVANVSHELRTPMNSILGMLQLSLDEDDLGDELYGWLQTAKQSADALLTLLNDLLDFSKLESHHVPIGAEPFSLREMLEAMVKPLAPAAFDKGIELFYHAAADMPDAVVGDRGRLRQVLTNLVANAIKFTEQGEVVLRVERGEAQAESGSASVRFSVCDTGIGIPAEQQESIFEPFAQGDPSSTRQYGGVGLGLAIARELVQRMGGELSIESAAGRGSRFSFEIPLQLEQQGAEQSGPQPPPQLQGLSVLVVDDNETHCAILAEILQSWGMQPETAIDVDHALGKLQSAASNQRHYALVLMDGSLTDGKSLELAERMAGCFEAPPPPILLMLSSVDCRTRKTQNGSGVIADLLQKPILAAGLLEKVVVTLGIQSATTRQITNEDRAAKLRPNGRQLRVLVAEDIPANQHLVVSALTKCGHQVTVADNGRDAVEAWQAEPFDVLLMDVEMPILDGYQATAEIREQESSRGGHIPIVAMTAHAMAGARESCLSAGMDDYLAKPIDVQQLIQMVEQIAGEPRTGSTATGGSAEAGGSLETGGSTEADGAVEVSDAVEVSGPLQLDPPLNRAAALKRLGGDEQLFREFVGIFDEDSPTLLRSIQTAADRGDLEVLAQSAHSLKGLAATFDANAVVDIAARIETTARSSQLDEGRMLVGQLSLEMQRLNAALAEYRPPVVAGRAD